MTAALLTLLSLTACATVDPLNDAARQEADAGQVAGAVDAVTQLPDQPSDCLRTERSGVADGDRLDVALLKTDQALGRANSRTRRCAQWYRDLQQSRERSADGG